MSELLTNVDEHALGNKLKALEARKKNLLEVQKFTSNSLKKSTKAPSKTDDAKQGCEIKKKRKRQSAESSENPKTSLSSSSSSSSSTSDYQFPTPKKRKLSEIQFDDEERKVFGGFSKNFEFFSEFVNEYDAKIEKIAQNHMKKKEEMKSNIKELKNQARVLDRFLKILQNLRLT